MFGIKCPNVQSKSNKNNKKKAYSKWLPGELLSQQGKILYMVREPLDNGSPNIGL
jgi:hypothetical protein